MLDRKSNFCKIFKFDPTKSITFKQAFAIVVCLHIVGFVGFTQISAYRARVAKENAERKKLESQEKLPQLWNNEGIAPRVVATPKPTTKPKKKEESQFIASIIQKYNQITNSLYKSWTSFNTPPVAKKYVQPKPVKVVNNNKTPVKKPVNAVPKPQPKPQTVKETPKRLPPAVEYRIKNYNAAPPTRPKRAVAVPSLLDDVKIDESITVYEPQTWVAENGEVLTSTTSRKTTTYIIPQ